MINDKIKAELENFMKEYEEKANTKDFDIIIPFIDQNAIFWFSEGSFIGYEQIREAFEKTWKSLKDEHYSISNIKWLTIVEDSATCIYKFTSESKSNTGPVIFSGRGTNVLVKKSDIWLIIHEHLSLEPKKSKN